MNKKRYILFFLFSFFSIFFCTKDIGLETFRVRKCHIIDLPKNAESFLPSSIKANVGDGIAVILPEDRTFLQGLEFCIKPPNEVQGYYDAIAVCFYKDILPLPQENLIDFSAQSCYFAPLPQSLVSYYQLALGDDFQIKKSPYMITVDGFQKTTDCIFLRLQLVMKGASDALFESFFEIQAKPLFCDSGLLEVTAIDDASKLPFKEEYSIYVDKLPYSQGTLLSSGEHHLYLQAKGYRNEVRTLNIEAAKTTNVAVAFRDIKPTVLIVAPSGTKVFFDEKEVQNIQEQIITTPGEHSVRFVVGNYETLKTLTTQEGKSYQISLNVDATITQTD